MLNPVPYGNSFDTVLYPFIEFHYLWRISIFSRDETNHANSEKYTDDNISQFIEEKIMIDSFMSYYSLLYFANILEQQPSYL